MFSAAEIALAVTAAVIISPIAWIPYWVLLLPAVAAIAATRRLGLDAVVIAFGLLVTGVAAWRRDAPGFETLAAALLVAVALGAELADRRRV